MYLSRVVFTKLFCFRVDGCYHLCSPQAVSCALIRVTPTVILQTSYIYIELLGLTSSSWCFGETLLALAGSAWCHWDSSHLLYRYLCSISLSQVFVDMKLQHNRVLRRSSKTHFPLTACLQSAAIYSPFNNRNQSTFFTALWSSSGAAAMTPGTSMFCHAPNLLSWIRWYG